MNFLHLDLECSDGSSGISTVTQRASLSPFRFRWLMLWFQLDDTNRWASRLRQATTSITINYASLDDCSTPKSQGGTDQANISTNRMPATEEELTWARTIKSAAAEKGVSGVTDFEYLQHGIVSKGNVEKSLKRIERLATFRKQYALKGYSEDNPRQLMESLNALCPGFFPGLGRDGEGHAVLTSIYRDFDPSKLSSEKDWRDLMGAFYYLLNAMCADADGIRAGVIFVCDCKGLGWNNFSLEAEKRAAALYQDAYAVRFKHMFMLDAPLIVR